MQKVPDGKVNDRRARGKPDEWLGEERFVVDGPIQNPDGSLHGLFLSMALDPP